MTIRCDSDSCNQLITEYDDDVYLDFRGAKYRFCCDRCAKDWLEEHQDEVNDFLLNDSGMFIDEEATKEKEYR